MLNWVWVCLEGVEQTDTDILSFPLGQHIFPWHNCLITHKHICTVVSKNLKIHLFIIFKWELQADGSVPYAKGNSQTGRESAQAVQRGSTAYGMKAVSYNLCRLSQIWCEGKVMHINTLSSAYIIGFVDTTLFQHVRSSQLLPKLSSKIRFDVFLFSVITNKIQQSLSLITLPLQFLRFQITFLVLSNCLLCLLHIDAPLQFPPMSTTHYHLHTLQVSLP